MDQNQFQRGDRVYYDDSPGTFVRWEAVVKWDTGAHGTVDPSDLLTEAQYTALQEEETP